MPKFATKAADNMFCQARYEAAKFNERLSSREGAAEELGVEHLDLICEALDCELDELIIRVPNKESSITHTRQGTQKSNDK